MKNHVFNFFYFLTFLSDGRWCCCCNTCTCDGSHCCRRLFPVKCLNADLILQWSSDVYPGQTSDNQIADDLLGPHPYKISAKIVHQDPTISDVFLTTRFVTILAARHPSKSRKNLELRIRFFLISCVFSVRTRSFILISSDTHSQVSNNLKIRLNRFWWEIIRNMQLKKSSSTDSTQEDDENCFLKIKSISTDFTKEENWNRFLLIFLFLYRLPFTVLFRAFHTIWATRKTAQVPWMKSL